MFQLIRGILAFVAVVFLLPAAATAGWWSMQERPATWRAADWSSSGVLPGAADDADAAIYVMAARTGGLKGALSLHSWIVIKRPGSTRYERFDKVGWGNPIRRDGYPADAFWYSNRPAVVHAVTGEDAAGLIDDVDAAIADYPYAGQGGYRIWPGPNSNSFVAYVLARVPQLGGPLPPNATGRDFAPGLAEFRISADGSDIHATIGGYVGFSAGRRSGFEIHLLGLAAGIDVMRPALKIPALGRVDLW